MAGNGVNTIDPNTGTTTFSGPSELTPGNHKGMPTRTDAYEPTDERGHVQASSLGGSNRRNNVVPQAKDLNHGSWYNMEKGERNALKDKATIQTEKSAIGNGKPGGRPVAFTVNDSITFADGKTQNVSLSFNNMQDEKQEGLNRESAEKASELMNETPNPGDTLRENMTTEEYTELMEETDPFLPNIEENFTEWDYQGNPTAATEPGAEWNGGVAMDTPGTDVDAVATDLDTGVTADDSGADDPSTDDPGTDADPDGGGDDGPSIDDED